MGTGAGLGVCGHYLDADIRGISEHVIDAAQGTEGRCVLRAKAEQAGEEAEGNDGEGVVFERHTGMAKANLFVLVSKQMGSNLR